MLLRFGAANFRSIWEYQEVSLVATSLKDTGPELLSSPAIREKVLPVVALYGANASGKTTMVKALERLSNIVELSHAKGGPTSKFPRSPNALVKDAETTPTRLDVDFIVQGVRYHYGFEILDDAVKKEWLYAFNGPYKNVWFERTAGAPIAFGRALKGRNRVIEEITRTNSLFLSAAAQNAHEQLTPLFEYLTKKIRYRINNASSGDEFSIAREGFLDKRAVDFLKYADTGIAEAKLEDIQPPEEAKKLVEGLRKLFSEVNETTDDVEFSVEPALRRLKLGHSAGDGNLVFLDPEQESRGTIKLLGVISDVFKCLDDGCVLVIDELDNSLHTVLARCVVEMFNKQSGHTNPGQLVLTTHDTNLMRGSLFRRDQIWLAEKDRTGQTCVYPLSDIRVRSSDNLEKGYLQGRFGAIPFLGADDVYFAAENIPA